MRKSKRLIAILATVALIVTMLIPMSAVPALASGSISALSVPTVTDDPALAQALGTIKVTVPSNSISNGDSVIFKLPAGYDFNVPFNGTAQAVRDINGDGVMDANEFNCVVVPPTINAAGDANGLLAANIAVNVLNADDEVQLTAIADQNFDFTFYIYLGNIEVESGTSSDCVVNFDGPNVTGFPLGQVVVAKSTATGKIILMPTGQDTANDNFSFDLRVKEETMKALELGADSVNVDLPSGYKWTFLGGVNTLNIPVPAVWGEAISVNVRFNNSGSKLFVDFNGIDLNGDGVADVARATNQASCWDFKNITFTVDNESDCTPGDIIGSIGGNSDTNVSEGPLGTYGEFGSTVSAKNTTDVIAGQDEQDVGDIVIKEGIAATLVVGRTVTLTLPEGVAWWPVYDTDVNGVALANLPNFKTDQGLRLNFTSFTGTNDRTAKYTVAVASAKAANITLEKLKVSVEAGFEGDVSVKVAGTAGVTGDVVIANALAPFTATADSTPNVIIGASSQAAGVVTIKESAKKCFIGDGVVRLVLPTDVEFDGTPTITVTEGNLKIANVKRAAGNNRVVTFTVDSESSKPSTIEISNIKVKLYRTVPEGEIALKVQGNGALVTDAYTEWTNSDTAVKVAVANCATPAPGEEKATVVFKINDTNFTVNGVAMTMDVAPYIKDGRTFLPVRYVAQACGVSAANILFSNGKVTLIKGDKVVQLTIGSKSMLINGASIDMDVAAEISNGRTMLPFRWIAQALGASVSYDEATQTVTMTL